MAERDPLFVAIDFGTGGGKCAVFDADGRRMVVRRRPWSYDRVDFPYAELTGGFSFDPHRFWEELAACVRDALAEAEIAPERIAGVATTAQRLGTILLDARGREIFAAPNLDGRGFEGALEVIEKLGLERTVEITGHWPPFVSSLARLIVHRKDPNRPRVAYVLTLNDWIAYRLCGALASEPSNAGESALLDVRRRAWSSDILDAFEIDERLLPPIVEPSARLGRVTAEAAERTGLAVGTPVYAGGADTQCALLGSGVVAPGAASAVLGTTAPVMVVTAEPHFERTGRLWTGCHVVPGRWTLESNAGDAGIAYEWWVAMLGFEGDDGLERAEQAAAALPADPEPALCFAGPTVFDLDSFNPNRPQGILFRQPPFTDRPTRGAFLRAFLANVACAVRANQEQIQSRSGLTPRSLTLSGGMTRSPTLLAICSRLLRVPLAVSEEPHATALGAAVLAAVGHGAYRDVAEATRRMVRTRPLETDPTEAWDGYYARWREYYDDLQKRAI